MRYFLIFWAVSLIGSSQAGESFESGNQFYNSGNYQKAASEYRSVLSENLHSASLYYNLANCYYKLNEVALSIFYYEKALQLSPNNSDYKSNLSFAKNMTIDDIEVVPEIGLSKIGKSIINVFNFDVWAIFSVAFVLVFVILFLGYYFSNATTKKRLAFIVSSSALVLAIICLFFAQQKYHFTINDKPAIVFVKETDIKTEHNLRSEVMFTLHEGT